jgi:putative addiction module killer protein
VEREQAIILEHVNRLRAGIGTIKPLGDKLWELKIRFGPRYRVYYIQDGANLIVLLAGSLKRAQKRTISLARRLMNEYNQEKRNAA